MVSTTLMIIAGIMENLLKVQIVLTYLTSSLFIAAEPLSSLDIECPVPGLDDFREPPWSIGVCNGSTGHIVCSATLVAPTVALTSALCVSYLRTTSHEVYLCNGVERTSERRNITRLMAHQDFVKDRLWLNSVGTIEFEKPFHGTSPLCLPTEGTNFEQENCIVTGWGSETDQGLGGIRRQPAKVLGNRCSYPELPQKELDKMKNYKGLLCVGGRDYTGACKGDDGATLACEDPSGRGYVLAGLLVVGADRERCDVPSTDLPDFFTNVPHFLPWVNKHIAVSTPKKPTQYNSAATLSTMTLTWITFALCIYRF